MSRQPRTRTQRLVDDWAPPRLKRAVGRRRASGEPGTRPAPKRAPASAPAAPTPPTKAPPQPGPAAAAEPSAPEPPADDPRWAALTERTLTELKACDPIYRPTSFWGPGLDDLLNDLTTMGLSRFKRWPRAGFWFLPVYGNGFTNAILKRVHRRTQLIHPGARKEYVYAALNGVFLAQRDHDVAQLAWDQSRWPADLENLGESTVGEPWQHFPLGNGVGFGKGYLNYLLLMAALSRHIERPPTSVLEIGGGFGVLGEILMSRDPEVRYVDLDIPPLVTVSSYYLTELFGHDRVLTYDERVASSGPIEVPRSACLPNWRIDDISGPFDVFVNSFSFQEMEPDVVDHYIDRVSALGVEYAISLNSVGGKPKVADGNEVGVVDPVTSARIIEMFERRGYELLATYNRPLVRSAGEVAVLRRRDMADGDPSRPL